MERIGVPFLVADLVSHIPEHAQLDAGHRVVRLRFLGCRGWCEWRRHDPKRVARSTAFDGYERRASCGAIQSGLKLLYLRLQLLNLFVHPVYGVTFVFARLVGRVS